MATLEQLEAALRAADAAGNTEDAKRLAQAYASARSQAPKADHYAELQQRAAAMPQVDPTEGNNFAQNALIGYGKSGMDSARGIGQALGLVSAEDVDAARQQDAPLMHTAGGVLGNYAGQAHQMLAMPEVRGVAALGKAAPYINSALQGAAFSAAQGVGTGESRAGNTAAGGALGLLGQGVSKGAGVLAQRAKTALTEPVRDSIELARRAGIPLHLSQVTDSKALKTATSALNYLPFSGAGRAGRNQQEAFNAAVGRSFGVEDGKQLTQGVMQQARQNIGKIYDAVFDRNNVTLGNDTLRRMAAIESDALQDLTADKATVVSNQLQRILRDAGDAGEMTGKKYQSLRGKLREVAAESGNKYVKQLGQELDAAAHASVGPEDAVALKTANGMWANMRTAQKALEQVEGSKGNIKPAALWNLIKKGSTPEMRKLAEIGQNVLKDPIPDSGTPARELIYRGLGIGGGGAGAATALGVLAPAAKLAATGVTLARFLNSKTAAKMLGEGKPTSALAKLLQPAPRLLPLEASAVSPLLYRKDQP